MQDGDGSLRGSRRRPTVRAGPPDRRSLAHPGSDPHHERVSREALGDAPPDALADERSGRDAAPSATDVLATVDIERPPAGPDDGDDDPRDARGGHQDDAHRDDGGEHGDLDLDGTDPPDATAAVAAPPRPARSRLVTAAAVVGLLVVGALAGATSARQQGQAQLDAAARVLVAVHVDQDGFFGGGVGVQNGDALQLVEISMTGTVAGAEQVTVERLRTPVGVFDVYAPVTTGDARPAQRTLLKGTVDCDRAEALQDGGTVTGRVLEGSTAVVRPGGSRRDAEVPVVVPNPGATLLTFDQRCNPQNYGPVDAPAYSAGALVAHADGTLAFVVSPGTAVPLRSTPARLAVVSFTGGSGGVPFSELLPAQETADSATFAIPDTRWSLTVSPRLPRVVDKPTLVQVRFGYFCRRSRGTNQPALPSLPPIAIGTVSSTGSVNPYLEGWDDAVMASAMTAAAVNACARPSSGPPPTVPTIPAPTVPTNPTATS